MVVVVAPAAVIAGYLFSNMNIFQEVPIIGSAEIFMVKNVATCIHDKAARSKNMKYVLVVRKKTQLNSVTSYKAGHTHMGS